MHIIFDELARLNHFMRLLLVGFLAAACTPFGVFAKDVESTNSQPLPIEAFAKLPAFSMPRLSPDGKRLAFRLIKNSKPLLVVQSVTKNGETLDVPIKAIGIGEKYVTNIHWANNDRLILNVRTAVVGKEEGGFYNRLISVGIHPDSPPPVDLSAKLKKRNKKSYHIAESDHRPYIVNRLKHDDKTVLAVLEYVLEQVNKSSRYYYFVPDFHEVDIYTGRSKRQGRNSRLLQWMIVDELDRPRVGWFSQPMKGYNHNRYKLYYRKNEGSSWRQLQRITYLEHNNLKPLRFDFDNQNILLVSLREHGSDYNLVDDTLYPVFKYDLTQKKILGEYTNDRQVKLKVLLKNALPELTHEIVSVDEERSSYVVESYAGDKPSIYYLVDMNTKSLQRLGREYAHLDEAHLAMRESIEYVARDGVKIPAFITSAYKRNGSTLSDELPPLIVFPHGGPFSKDRHGFDRYAHFFADRGYTVLQPQFRGSTGLGIAHEEAGYGEWAGKMQQDITDSVHWLAKQKRIDKKRICIVGFSYGGYSAAWGAINHSSLYSCAISVNGVMDLEELVRDRDYLMMDALGRPFFNERHEVAAGSPYAHSEQITIPVMLLAAQGDAVVPIKHSAKMFKKMQKNGQEVSYVELPQGEHWSTNEQNEIRIFTEIETFLATHLNSSVEQQ